MFNKVNVDYMALILGLKVSDLSPEERLREFDRPVRNLSALDGEDQVLGLLERYLELGYDEWDIDSLYNKYQEISQQDPAGMLHAIKWVCSKPMASCTEAHIELNYECPDPKYIPGFLVKFLNESLAFRPVTYQIKMSTLEHYEYSYPTVIIRGLIPGHVNMIVEELMCSFGIYSPSIVDTL